MKTQPLSSLASRILRRAGADVEEDEQLLMCLLSPTLAERLLVEEEWLLSMEPTEAVDALHYGSDALGRILALGREEGFLGHVELTEVAAPGGGLRGELLRTVTLVDCIGEVERTHVKKGSYLLVFARYTAKSGELEQSGMIHFACNEETLVAAPWLFEGLKNRKQKSTKPPAWRTPFEELDRYLRSSLETLLEEETAPFFQKVQHRLSRERRYLERLHRRERKSILQPFLEADPELQEVIQLELQEAEKGFLQKVQALPSQFPWEITCQRFAALRVTMPVSVVDYSVKKRKLQRTVPWIWNPLIERFEPRACERSGNEIFQIALNDQLQIVDPSLSSPS